jgi:phosphotransferase system  glucose/maltose/N-acetylglucosamine-specific IIC component
MRDDPKFAELREDIEAKQKATVWPDTMRNGSSVDAFLWKGDPQAKPIQRAGLVVFGFAFLIFAIVIASIPFEKNFEDGGVIDFLMALFALLISLRLFRNALLRLPKRQKHEGD